MRRGATFLAVGVASVLSIGACGSSTGSSHVRTGSIPTGATDVVLRVDTRGGFTPVEYQLGIVPELTVYGDGRVIVSGPVTEQYPPHALPNLLTGHLDRATVAALIERAEADGLFGTLDFGEPGITDNPTTTVTIDDGSPHTQRAYALGVEASAQDTEDPTPPDQFRAALGLTDEQLQARRKLSGFVRSATEAATRVATDPYVASEVAIYVRPAGPPTTDDIAPGTMGWPLGDLATLGTPLDAGAGADSVYRCAVLIGADTPTALAAAARAASTTRWDSGGAQYSIVWRPLLPEEHACPGLDPT